MKPTEILAALPEWANATPETLLASPAWAMPCRLGEEACSMRLGGVHAVDTLDLEIKLQDAPHVLGIPDSARFPELHALWAARSEVPEPILLALVEKECGPLLQLIENAARRQLKLVGLAPAATEEERPRLHVQVCPEGGAEPLCFSLTPSEDLAVAWGQLRLIDTNHPSIRAMELEAVRELAVIAMPPSDLSTIAPGDALLLPELASGQAQLRLVVAGLFAVRGADVSAWNDDGLPRVVAAETERISLGDLFDRMAEDAAVPASEPLAEDSHLRMVKGGQILAEGRLGRIASQPAFIIDTAGPAAR